MKNARLAVRRLLGFLKGMPRSRRLMGTPIVAYLASMLGPTPAFGATLSGDSIYDGHTGLWTYTYYVDNSNGVADIREISILIDSSTKDGPEPVIHNEPVGWRIGRAESGASAQPPINAFGTFWVWEPNFGEAGPILVGQTLRGFSFSTIVAPAVGVGNNYFLYSTTYSGGPPNIGEGGVVEYGKIAAPNFLGSNQVLPAPVPVIPAWPCMVFGLSALAGVMRRPTQAA
jgi:hypothetical protein